jgi:predicted esterase
MQLLVALCLLSLTHAAAATTDPGALPATRGSGALISAANGGARRLLQDQRPALPAQSDWWSAVLASNTDGQQSWWMDIATRISTAAAQAVGQQSAQDALQRTGLAGGPPPAAFGAPPAGFGAQPPPSPLDSSQLTASERASGLDSSSVWPPTSFVDSKERTAYEESTINSTDAEPCRPAGDGGLLCGIPIGYKGVANRTGYYYLPKTYTQGPLPVLVLLHGAGVNGSWMLTDLPFMESADNHQVIVITPDSIDDMDWTNPRQAKDGYTHDWWHIEACYRWFALNNPQGAQIDANNVAIAGNSRAGYTGPPFCSRSTLVPCNGAVILHASANADEMGSKVIPILWTAGENDPLYTEERNAGEIAAFKQAAPQFPITYQIWESSHSLTKSQEIDFVVKWGADQSFRGTPAPPLGSYRRRLAASPVERQQEAAFTA